MQIFEIFKVCDRSAIRASVTQTGKCSKNRPTGRELPLESVRRRVGLAPKAPIKRSAADREAPNPELEALPLAAARVAWPSRVRLQRTAHYAAERSECPSPW